MLPGLLLMLLAFTTYNNACVYTARHCINYLEIIAPIYGLPRAFQLCFCCPVFTTYNNVYIVLTC